MSQDKISSTLKGLAVITFIAIAVKYWSASIGGLALLLSPYPVLFYLANENNDKTVKLVFIRGITAIIVYLTSIGLLFTVVPESQAGLSLMFGVIIQLSVIATSELFIGLFNGEQPGI